ncbi:aldo/keto reductase [Herbiconiux sp. CPCC 203407]|uniref:Aldo/keto reductase n=1 Tax=Herbiconiux oxytropis TaxID=2970915 RepID=A0AA42BSU9_9MICO|nr:aldo/keto reductase [Herbiconiux oxytropis]MCS5722108.1 aldo/keto reductase [Herbiconiux oxytropis]MCS5725690.1 aldo/keto reductase [Herbiconiux oxytropis]
MSDPASAASGTEPETGDGQGIASRLGLGLAAIGRPAYITAGRDDDLGDPADRSVDALRQRAHALLDGAWWLGLRYVDAARSYGLAEQFLGSWLAAHPGRRDELTIGSKWGYAYTGDWRMDAAEHEHKEHSLARFEQQWPESLEALGTEPDVYLVHSLTPESPALGDRALLDRLRALADSGVRVGFSTSGPRQGELIDRMLDGDSPFSAVQTTWNLLEPSAGDALARANDARWLVVVKESLANGRLAGSAPGLPEQRAAALAEADGQSLAGLALGAVVAEPWADIVLTGAVTRRQLRENVAARPPRVPADALAALAEPPEQYWAARSARPWS